MKAFAWFLLFALGAAAVSPLAAFRTVSPQTLAEEKVKRLEEGFSISRHAELYRYVRQLADGSSETGEMCIIFEYHADKVLGVFRVFPSEYTQGATLLNIQRFGDLPELYLCDPAKNVCGRIPLDRIDEKLANTDWFLEGIFDDDKNDWSYVTAGTSQIRGRLCSVIEARYENPDLAAASPFAFRRMYLEKRDSRPVTNEYFDRSGFLRYTLELLSSEQFELLGKKQNRPSQLMLRDYETSTTTLLTRVRSAWNPELPQIIVDADQIAQWDAETDEALYSALSAEATP